MGEFIAQSGLSANDLKEATEREEFAQAMHKQAFVRKFGGDKVAAEQFLAKKQLSRQPRRG